ncbi:predicted protein [Plenodomus lingam JN3]|uniref:Predicted protein n=1 Tax=Leptosphaeria maculans (strain JN3 / isolate v23.1.3 / race Av1-4-5-6-7-8) TaxID=985895 RepID=E5A9T5_LEPMJ|nr:predicted protein [Plenodomus lingam JN3]CBY00426.1 predicted protein [Plenodomus lingam JN3]
MGVTGIKIGLILENRQYVAVAISRYINTGQCTVPEMSPFSRDDMFARTCRNALNFPPATLSYNAVGG